MRTERALERDKQVPQRCYEGEIMLSLLVGAVAAIMSVVLTAGPQIEHITASGVFGTTAEAYTYNTEFVPVGSRARVDALYIGGGTTIVTLLIRGLLPNREYGAHAHVADCTAVPEGAGAHFQYVQGGATDPAFANPQNEIWLDFTTDAQGNAQARSIVGWQFPADRRAHSVVIHDHHTSHDPGEAGTAGPRHGCLTVAF